MVFGGFFDGVHDSAWRIGDRHRGVRVYKCNTSRRRQQARIDLLSVQLRLGKLVAPISFETVNSIRRRLLLRHSPSSTHPTLNLFSNPTAHEL